MPEATDLLVRRGDMTAGLWIRWVGSPASAVARSQRFVRPEDNKENVSPEGYVGPTPRRRRQRARKSPLPDWYPRTPLRDITNIVNALERRRLQVLAARAVQANSNTEVSPGNSLLASPSSSELSANAQIALTDFSPLNISACIASSPVEHPLPTSSTSSSVSEIDISPSSKKRTETEEKLCRSIDQIEKIVRRNNVKKTVKEASAKRVMQRKTLMSMR